MVLVEIHIAAMNASKSSPGNFVVILQESDGTRKIAITIGAMEAQSIAVALEEMQTIRPLTHDLMMNILDATSIKIKEVIISHQDNDAFVSHLVIQKSGDQIEINSRASDALALSVRAECPILINEILLDSNQILDTEGRLFSTKRGKLEQYSLEELELLLKKVLIKEDYESAEVIRKIIASKKEG